MRRTGFYAGNHAADPRSLSKRARRLGFSTLSPRPDGRIVGLSKLPRLLEIYARRLQVQERLTREVADTLGNTLRPRGVAIRIEVAHFCLMMRGMEKQDPRTVTSSYRGEFRTSHALRREFLVAVVDSRPLK